MGEELKFTRNPEKHVHIPEAMSILPLRNSVFFPKQFMPLSVGRESTIKLIEDVSKSGELILIVAQKEPQIEKPTPDDIYHFGTVAKILKVYNLPDGSKSVFVQGLHRAKILSFIQQEPYLRGVIQQVDDEGEIDLEDEAVAVAIKNVFKKVVELSPDLTPEQANMVSGTDDIYALPDIVGSILNVSVAEKQEILEQVNIKERLRKCHFILNRHAQRLELGNKIQAEVQDEITKNQREYFLREQLKAIKRELGEDEEGAEIRELREKIEKANMPEEARKVALKELERLSRMHPSSAEYTVARTYLDWLIELPWSISTEDNLDIKKAEEILERDHYGLERVKKRILEYLAVRKLKNDMRGPILCFVGPPGVGKTSLGRSIAEALGRKFVRISLGGVHDEAEIRGHRRTYIGALPGRIIQGIRKAGSNNPVFMLDEVDKIGADFRGDPAAALLEVLDPEQNHSFSDHYIEVPFDLSKVMFIATANMIEPIPPALRDRMEIIEIPSYIEEEKLNIAKYFLVPKQIKAHGLTEDMIKFEDSAIRKIINSYTREAGVRNLERRIADICRGVAKDVALGKTEPTTITEDVIPKYLGQPKYYHEAAERINKPGIAMGLAWTPVGGEILFVEATKMKGKGALHLTGQLGDVMKESAHIALSYIASKSDEFGIDPDFREKYDIHIHVPAGAIPKDGPSAGVTILTALYSLLKGKVVCNDIAMTGEITLRGAVLPVGGIKEKVLAAHRAGIKKVILPEKNKADVEEIPEQVRSEMEFYFVREMDEVLELAVKKEEVCEVVE
ncbi:ATP-dependent Lon protease [Candidatus Kryptobacter tengchongensis]|uniref:Lon protease n=1 Tax=Kryptobacter tengchongensis TaxID=1643429 RepID=A0A656D647_KRYT1|nr:endopeptidase La [Candidatus Kryptobacter tengchongensis]CUS83453.1 ATP-dependent Lon protease [Candidatus Kryptobacter tengchongensis]CUS99301.1 ATP-dependent Lon protease [Candidatus Kryptobacter tengchongensis]CUU06227.1 ATP-dependent Lon protease [Candidatus Kryptobacter tengchongensis]